MKDLWALQCGLFYLYRVCETVHRIVAEELCMQDCVTLASMPIASLNGTHHEQCCLEAHVPPSQLDAEKWRPPNTQAHTGAG